MATRIVFTVAGVVLFTTISATGGGAPGLRGGVQPEQVLVFDAGSSGTRIHIFNIYPAEGSGHVPVVDLSVRSKQTLKVKPGLSDFAQRDDIDGTKTNIMKLLEFANQFVPADRRASTPAMLKATAGLRSVSETKAEAVLNAVRETLANSGYKFKHDWAGIIKGKEEGGLAWVAANYLDGTFAKDESTSVGVIEMGGGSTQVTFQVAASDALEPNDDFVFETALKKRYRLYAHSYLGFGQDHAQTAMRALVGTEDPCYPKGYTRSSPTGTLVHGDGNGQSCMATIASKLWSTSATAPGRYAMEVPLVGSFVATENFFYTQADEKLGWEDRVMSISDFAAGVEKTCGHDLPEEEARKMASGGGDPASPKYCFALAYQGELLKALKAISNDVNVRIRHQINGGDIDWALGAAIIHYIQGHPVPPSLPPWTLLLLLLFLLPLSARLIMQNSCAGQTLAQIAGLNVKATKFGAGTTGPVE